MQFYTPPPILGAGGRLLHHSESSASPTIPISELKQKISECSRGIKDVGSAKARKINKAFGPGTQSSLYGYLGYSDATDFKAGLYNITPAGVMLKWDDPLYEDATLSLQTGWLRNGRICGFIPYYYLSQLVTVIYIEMDFENGEILSFLDRDAKEGAFEVCAYNPVDDFIYGYGFDDKGDWWFMRAPATAPFATENIKKLSSMKEQREVCSALTYNLKDKTVYGVNADNNLVAITPMGMQHTAMALDQYALPYVSGLSYSTSQDLFYWNSTVKAPGYLNEVSYLTSIDLYNRSYERVDEYENTEQYMFFVDTDTSFNPEAPAEGKLVSSDFTTGETSGAVSWTLPVATCGGKDIEGTLSWSVLLDGDQIYEGEGTPGEKVSSSFEKLSEGLHYISLRVSSDGLFGPDCYNEIYVGQDTPDAPRAVTLSSSKVSWEAVNTGVHGGYVDASAMKYRVYINEVFEAETAVTSLSVDIPTSGPLKRYEAKVIAVAGEKSSKPAYSNPLIEGTPLSLDVTFPPTIEQVNLMQRFDGDGDGYSWAYNSEKGCLQSEYSEAGPTDDWLILPMIDFDNADIFYSVSVEAACVNSDRTEEWFEVRYGKEVVPEAMTTAVIERSKPGIKGYQTISGLFSIKQPGAGYIALHSISDPNQYGIQIRNIKVSRTEIVADSPSAVGDLSGKGMADGSLKAEVSFTLPTANLAGKLYDADTEIEVVVNGVADTVKTSGKPGEKKTVTLKTVQGFNHITVTALVAGKESPAKETDVYTGFDIPSPVSGLVSEVDADMLSMTLTWDAPTVGYNGGVLNPKTLQYDIYALTDTGAGYGWAQIGTTTQTGCIYSVEEGAEQQIVQVGVLAKNDLGDSGRLQTVIELLGTPYSLPMKETFPQQTGYDCPPWVIYSPTKEYDADWGIGEFSSFVPGVDGFGIIGNGNVPGAKGRIGFPRFSTAGMDRVDVSMLLWGGENAASSVLLGYGYGMTEPIEIAKSVQGEGMVTLNAVMPESLLNLPWVQLYIDADFPKANSVILLDEISVDGEFSSISDIKSDCRFLRPGKGSLCIGGEESDKFCIYSISGMLIKSGVIGKEPVTLFLPQGIYIVCSAGARVKAVVR
ncbi:MAG: hypothetical protein K2K81_10955 [Muribaculaceae bacterium]|nr:hypothetical protein [Muribaculaceae bacterium]